MLARATLVFLVAGLIVVPSSSAALETKLSIAPKRPVAGAVAKVTVRPFWPFRRPDGTCCSLAPAKRHYPFRLQALGPDGAKIVFRPARTRDPYVWRGRVRFPRSGRWEIRVTNYYVSQADATRALNYPAGAPKLSVTVSPRSRS